MNTLIFRICLVLGLALMIVDCAKTSNSGTTTTAAATTCSSGYLYSSVYGCQVQCGTNMIMYNNQCISTTSTTTTTTTTTTGTTGTIYTGTTTTTNICQQNCPAGMVLVGYTCLPQATCGACYGYSGGYCYMGNGAPALYGY